MRSIMQLATSIMFFFTIGLILSGVGVSHVQAQLTTAMLGTYTGSTQCDGITGELEGPLLFGPGNQIILSQDATGLTLFTDGAYQGACTAAATGFIGASCRCGNRCEFGVTTSFSSLGSDKSKIRTQGCRRSSFWPSPSIRSALKIVLAAAHGTTD